MFLSASTCQIIGSNSIDSSSDVWRHLSFCSISWNIPQKVGVTSRVSLCLLLPTAVSKTVCPCAVSGVISRLWKSAQNIALGLYVLFGGTFKIINITNIFLNTHSNKTQAFSCFCLTVSVNLSVKNLPLPSHVRRRLFSLNERSKSRVHIKMLTLTACSKSGTQTIMSFQIHVQNFDSGVTCFCLPVSVNLNLKSLSTRSYVWPRLFPLNTQPKS